MSEREGSTPIEQEDFSGHYELHGTFTGHNGGDEKIGDFQAFAEGQGKMINFVPNSEGTRPGSNTTVLESTYAGTVQRADSKDTHYYYLVFPENKASLYLSTMIGYLKNFKGSQWREVTASMGRFGDDYMTWKLSETEWQELDNWLSQHLPKTSSLDSIVTGDKTNSPEQFGSVEPEHRFTIDELIAMVKYFKPTPKAVSPSQIYQAGNLYPGLLDVAGVFAKVKPAALVNFSLDPNNLQLLNDFVRAASERGVTVKFAPSYENDDAVFSQTPEIADRLQKLLVMRFHQPGAIDPVDEERKIGQLLGYPQEAIEQYIQRRTDDGIYDRIRASLNKPPEIK